MQSNERHSLQVCQHQTSSDLSTPVPLLSEYSLYLAGGVGPCGMFLMKLLFIMR